MSSFPIGTGQLVLTAHVIYISRLCSGAAATLAIYDWCLVFGQEFDTIYRSKWSIPKALFYFIRIITPPGVIIGTIQLLDFREPLSKRCSGSVLFLTYAMITSICAAHCLFTLRLIALYKGNRFMVGFISTFFIATYIVTYGLAVASTIAISKFAVFYSEVFHVCASLGTTPLLPPIWYAPVAFETFLFSLTMYRAWQDARVISTASSAPLLVVFYRDGMIAFVVMTAVRAWNIWIYLTQSLSSIYVGTMLMWAISTVLTTRVYMNLVWLIRRPAATTGVSAGLEAASDDPSSDADSRIGFTSPKPIGDSRHSLTSRRNTQPKASLAPASEGLQMEMSERSKTLPQSRAGLKSSEEKYTLMEAGSGQGTSPSLDLPMDSWRRSSWRLEPPPMEH